MMEKKTEQEKLKNTAIALGKFDGFHLGHMLLLEQVLELQRQGLTGVIFTFKLMPNHVFDILDMKHIYTSEEKRALVCQMGIEKLVEYPFDDEFAAMSPESFIKNILVDMLDAKYIIVGEDYHFGKNRKGDVGLLLDMSSRYGYQVIVKKKKTVGEQIISSTLIRNRISAGDMQTVSRLLGRNYSISGKVTMGKQLGRTVGIPTANLAYDKEKLYPPAGVYASRIYVEGDDRIYQGITNIGDNPTVNNSGNITIETNIFDFNQDIYEKNIRVELIHGIRQEIKFNSVYELTCQMKKDIEEAKCILSRKNT
jgi:riboflavin kinase/FMN adenylyltransferase